MELAYQDEKFLCAFVGKATSRDGEITLIAFKDERWI